MSQPSENADLFARSRLLSEWASEVICTAQDIVAESRELCSKARSGGRNGGSRPRFQRTQQTEPDS